jgi:toxin-antitoxin system PIN domain toxin
VIIIDANILLYAYNADAPEHAASAAWLERTFSGTEAIGIPLASIWAFLRVITSGRLRPNPLPVAQAFEIVREWLDKPGVTMLQAGPRHLEILEEIVKRYKVTGPLITDAVIAALALEYGATVASADRDYARFDTLKWINPVS